MKSDLIVLATTVNNLNKIIRLFMNRDRVIEDAYGRRIDFFLREHGQELWFVLFPLL